VPGCLGVSAYKNTLNLYFRRIDHSTLYTLAIALHDQLVLTGTAVLLSGTSIGGQTSTTELYGALRAEALA
jgi:hypothetical protein